MSASQLIDLSVFQVSEVGCLEAKKCKDTNLKTSRSSRCTGEISGARGRMNGAKEDMRLKRHSGCEGDKIRSRTRLSA